MRTQPLEKDRSTAERVQSGQAVRLLDGPLQQVADRSFVVDDSLVYFDSAQGNHFSPAIEGCEAGVDLRSGTYSRPTTRHADFQQYLYALFTLRKEGAELLDLFGGVHQAVVIQPRDPIVSAK